MWSGFTRSGAAPPSTGDRTETADSDQRTVVWLWGEQDLLTASAAEETLAAAIARPAADVVVDVTDVSFMDCSGLGPLLHSRAVLAGQERVLTLRSPPRCVRVLLDTCGLAHLVEPLHEFAGGSRPGEVRNALQTWVELPAPDRTSRINEAPVEAVGEREWNPL